MHVHNQFKLFLETECLFRVGSGSGSVGTESGDLAHLIQHDHSPSLGMIRQASLGEMK